jgi:hypothetical protein
MPAMMQARPPRNPNTRPVELESLLPGEGGRRRRRRDSWSLGSVNDASSRETDWRPLQFGECPLGVAPCADKCESANLLSSSFGTSGTEHRGSLRRNFRSARTTDGP